MAEISHLFLDEKEKYHRKRGGDGLDILKSIHIHTQYTHFANFVPYIATHYKKATFKIQLNAPKMFF